MANSDSELALHLPEGFNPQRPKRSARYKLNLSPKDPTAAKSTTALLTSILIFVAFGATFAILLLVLVLASYGKVFSLQERGWTEAQGLPNNIVSLKASRDGSLWALSEESVFSRDRGNWVELPKMPPNIEGESYTSLGIFPSTAGIWTVGWTGVAFYKSGDQQWERMPFEVDCYSPNAAFVKGTGISVVCSSGLILNRQDDKWEHRETREAYPELNLDVEDWIEIHLSADEAITIVETNQSFWVEKDSVFVKLPLPETNQNLRFIGASEGYLWFEQKEWPGSFKAYVDTQTLAQNTKLTFLSVKEENIGSHGDIGILALPSPPEAMRADITTSGFYVVTTDSLLRLRQGSFERVKPLPSWPFWGLLAPAGEFVMDSNGDFIVLMKPDFKVYWLVVLLLAIMLVPLGWVNYRLFRKFSAKKRQASELVKELQDEYFAITGLVHGKPKFRKLKSIAIGLLTAIVIALVQIAQEDWGLWTLVGLLAALLGIVIFASRWMLAPFRQGNVALALSRAEILGTVHFPLSRNLRVAMLLDSGQFEMAKSVLIQKFTKLEKPSLFDYPYFGYMGLALAGLGEHAKSEKWFSAVLDMGYKEPSYFHGNALNYLLQGKDWEKALESIDSAIKYRRKWFRWFDNLSLGIDDEFTLHALRAWALASLNRADDSRAALETASGKVKRKNVIEVAAHHFYSGKAHAALGDNALAKYNYRQAMELCANSAGARFAASALRQI